MSLIRLVKLVDGVATGLGTVIRTQDSPYPVQASYNEFRPTENYLKDHVTFYNGELYQAKADIAAGQWNIDHWTAVNEYVGYIQEYQAGETYNLDEFVIHNDRLYKTKEDGITGTWDVSRWEELTANTTVETINAYLIDNHQLNKPLSSAVLKGNVRKLYLADGSIPGETSGVTAKIKTLIGYYPTWRTEFFGSGNTDLTIRKPSNSPSAFSHVKLSFAHTKPVFDPTSPDLTGIGFNTQSGLEAAFKEDIGKLRARGTKVYLSVGGATYGRPDVADAWTGLIDESDIIDAGSNDYPAQTPYTKALVDVIEYLDLDGIDLDFEDDMAWHTNVRTTWLDNQYKLLRLFRFIADTAGTALGRPIATATACWSTGWDSSAGSVADIATPDYDGNKVSYFGGSAGRDRSLYGGYTSVDLGGVMNASSFVDVFVNMTYDAIFSDFAGNEDPAGPFDSNYDPVKAYEQCRSIITDPNKICTIGVTNNPGFGDHELMVYSNQCAPSGPHPTVLDKDQYGNVIDAPFSVQRVTEAIEANLTQYPNDGIIQWSIYAIDPTTSYVHEGNAEASWKDIVDYVATKM
ncbi:hypothetical protein [Vibrio phage BONAISHI]|nr:hypothetical protein [Vibrio phage BONAISHI]